jgi:ubiquinone/menaquinone biosynthesis C-methylase UbiE
MRWLLPIVLLAVACGPIMVEREGRRVFNPNYSFILDGGSRDAWQKPEEVLDALAVAEGTVVADIGAGTGYFTARFSRRVGATGRVFASDVQPEMLEALRERVAEARLDNVTVVESSFSDPKLPSGCCDVVFFSSVYKEIDDREAYMRRVRRALRRGGRVAILEYRPDADGPGPPKSMRMSEAQISSEMERAGFELQEHHDFIDRELFLVYAPLQPTNDLRE